MCDKKHLIGISNNFQLQKTTEPTKGFTIYNLFRHLEKFSLKFKDQANSEMSKGTFIITIISEVCYLLQESTRLAMPSLWDKGSKEVDVEVSKISIKNLGDLLLTLS